MIGAAVLGGFVLDLLFGDPAWLPHPVVYMGRAISALERRLRTRLPRTPQGELLGGAILAFCLPVGTFLLTSLVCLGAAALSPWLGLAVQMFWCGQALAAKGLAQESTRVYRELIKPDLPAARRAVGRIARAMGMEVLAAGSRPTEEGRAIARYVELDELLARSDVLSLHCPLFPETVGIINRDTISQMKDGAMLINTARGGLLVEQDVADALNCGKLSGAAMDVASAEPIQPDNPLLTAKNCILTPHIAWAPKEARQRIMDLSAENLRAFLAGNPVHVVNKAALSRPSGACSKEG